MHTTSFLTILATALAASALQVTEPNANQGWASTGSNTLSWTRVSTDATNFTVFLTNVDRSVLPQNNQLLAAFVDATTATSVVIDAPSGGFPVGGHYRVNLVKSQTDPAIFAQSDEFNITSGAGTATGSTVSSGSTATSAPSGSISGTATGTGVTISNSANPSGTTGSDASSSSDLNPTQSSNAAGVHKAEFGLLSALLLLGGMLA